MAGMRGWAVLLPLLSHSRFPCRGVPRRGARAMPGLRKRPFDLLVCWFYGSQVLLAILFDSQSVLPVEWYPSVLTQANDWYIRTYGDPLVAGKPAWFRGCILFEVFIQIPFWIVATVAYARNLGWIRLPNLAFSLCSLTVMVPIVSELLLSEGRQGVLPFYAPFVVLPLIIAVKTAMFDDLHPRKPYLKEA